MIDRSVDRVLCLHVNAADRTLENADLGAVASGLDHAGLVLDANDLADDTANGGNLVANRERIAHFILLALLLFLGADHEEVHKYENEDKGQEHTEHTADAACIAASRTCC